MLYLHLLTLNFGYASCMFRKVTPRSGGRRPFLQLEGPSSIGSPVPFVSRGGDSRRSTYCMAGLLRTRQPHLQSQDMQYPGGNRPARILSGTGAIKCELDVYEYAAVRPCTAEFTWSLAAIRVCTFELRGTSRHLVMLLV